MSYNEIPNILVDSVVLPNKPLSNLEIMMLLKSYHCVDLEGYFWETLFQKKPKLNECGILNLDLSSGDGTHWVMWLKKVRIRSISIVMECNPLASWLHIWSHQYLQ